VLEQRFKDSQVKGGLVHLNIFKIIGICFSILQHWEVRTSRVRSNACIVDFNDKVSIN
jgi:hypothetical protein